MRLDALMHLRSLCESRTRAKELILRGRVSVNGRIVTKPSLDLPETAEITVSEGSMPVSRAGEKLAAALDRFGISCRGVTALDTGASTGGFTECMLGRGAAHVYALDVGHGQLHPALRADPRVTVMEGVNARYMTPSMFPSAPDMAVMDVSFISQSLIYPALSAVLPEGAPLITLVKPQFEAGREHIGKGGIVRLTDALVNVLFDRLSAAASGCGFVLKDRMVSPLKGGDGNTEFLALFIKDRRG